MKIYFSDKYYKGVTHLDITGKKEYFLDSIAKPLWISEKIKELNNIQILEPTLISNSDLLKVHSTRYINAIKTSYPNNLATSSGLRWVPELYEASLASVSGLYNSVKTSINESVSGTLSTNFHHAKKEKGSGFCVFNGVAISVLKAIKELNRNKILIVDCDFHYGDGTAELLRNNSKVFIYDIYGVFHKNNNSIVKAKNITNQKVTNPREYNNALNNLINFSNDYKPDLVIYDAGMDSYEGDRLGGIKGVDMKFLLNRDSIIFNHFSKSNIPVAFMLGGGYVPYKDNFGNMLSSMDIKKGRDKLIKLYLNTIKIASQTAV